MSNSQMEAMLADIDQSIIDNYYQRVLEVMKGNRNPSVSFIPFMMFPTIPTVYLFSGLPSYTPWKPKKR
ncbi:hypothetical protein BPOR_0572g00020 [Botrytis porri]|uniref:Uncharacterized protein n=1 Tax=Botrytis porri TaxID=87229 RepID=A0A4Z1KI74_9HELO|nr:hypothetical protein BPOR_0572g00020 [Botrytis porri]